MNDLEKTHHQTFKKIKKTNEQNQEFWCARDLQNVLAYSSWERFKSVIQKAVVACNNSKQPAQNHFHHVVKMVKIGFIEGLQGFKSDGNILCQVATYWTKFGLICIERKGHFRVTPYFNWLPGPGSNQGPID